MASIGIVAVDENFSWPGGQYYLQHLIKCVASLPAADQIPLRDVWWRERALSDPFQEVRTLLGDSIVIAPPSGLIYRILRKFRRHLRQISDARDLFLDRDISAFFPRLPCENSGLPFVFWLPDFRYLRRPDLMSEERRREFAENCRNNVHSAAQVVVSSEDAKRDFAVAFPHLISRVHVVRFCSVPDADWWTLDPTATASTFGLPNRFLIVCNQFTQYKNHLILLRALRSLVVRGLGDVHLVCTGSLVDHGGEDWIGQINRYISEYDLQQRVHILGLIPRTSQIALMRRAVAVLQPSRFEGWSTVIEDAKTLGKCVVASDLPVHREQLGDGHPYIVDAEAQDLWADAIADIWRNCDSGPIEVAENAAMLKLQQAKVDCGLAFVRALRAAQRDGQK